MESQEESLQERQENELQVLKAVFLDDVKDLRSELAWKVARPLDVLITLYPQQSAGGVHEFDCQVDLQVKCSHLYPNVIPSILLRNPKHVPLKDLTVLQDQLVNLAKRLRGEVMILELAQHVQVWLHNHNQAPRFHSFYDEMLSNQRKKEEEEKLVKLKQQECQKQETERKRKAIEEEILRKQEAFIIESRTRKESSPSPRSSLGDRKGSGASVESGKGLLTIGRKHRNSSKSESSNQDICEHSGTVEIVFNRPNKRCIQRGRCLGHSRRGSVVYNGLDMNSGELVIVIEWILNISKTVDREDRELERTLKQVEQEFNSLVKLRHRNLVPYLAFQYFNDRNKIIVQILQEFVTGSTLAYHLIDNIPVSCDFLKCYVQGILEGLAYLHSNSVVHRDLRDTSVFLEQGLLRIADYSIDKTISDLWSNVNKADLEEAFPPSIGRGGKKADIFRLGILCLSLLKGEIVDTMFPDIPKNLPAVILDFLERCMDRDEQKRWSAEKLLEHPFLRPSMIAELRYLNTQPEYHLEDKTETEPEVPIRISQDPNGKSRMHDEFIVLKYLGRGGFGEVYKVRNKLDAGIYAIKCIALKSQNKQMNRKIMREVKLLSRLNHENVVRYFNSWLEMAQVDPTKDNKSDLSSENTCQSIEFKPSISSGISEQFENAVVDNEETTNWRDSSDNDSSSSEDEYCFGNTFLSRMNLSSQIVFESVGGESTLNNTVCDDVEKNTDIRVSKEKEEQSSVKLVQFMYIQMEFCGKSTLRSVIDEGLYKDVKRVWRLFREIIEGLAHIHQQGMIHRDLKPVNIFMDLNDHVKIGDFGLATMSNFSRPDLAVATGTTGISEGDPSRSDSQADGSLTSWVGTLYYISPEVANNKSSIAYSQKVDIYSLGIIFFEMCYHNIVTFMERAKILEKVRSPDIELPSDFDARKNNNQVAIIKWLLDHDPNVRPTSLELLQSTYLPPLEIEEAEMHAMLDKTIANPQSKAYKHLIYSLFKPDTSVAANITYNMDIKNKVSFNNSHSVNLKFVIDTMINIFHKHGAVQVATPLIMPKTSLHESNENCVKLLDHGGGVITLPSDLRVPFCRYLVENNVSSLKRYFISNVYRERKVFCCHPRELLECAFDIVTPTHGSLMADAEVLNVVWEIVQEFPSIADVRSFVHINHVSLLKGILLHCGIPEETHQQVFGILNDAENFSKWNIHARLIALNISEQSASAFCRIIEVQGSLSKIRTLLKSVSKRKGREVSLIKQGLNDLETIISNTRAMGLPTSIIVTPNLVYKIDHFSGMLFQFVCELKKKRRKVNMEVIAAGGRYDKLISTMRSFVDLSENQEVGQFGVGFSIAVEKLVSATIDSNDYHLPNIFDVYICATGDVPFINEKANIMRELHSAGISAHMQFEATQSLEEIRDYCKEVKAYAVILNNGEPIKVTCWDKDRFSDKKIQRNELIDYLLQKLVTKVDNSESVSPSVAKLENVRLERSASESQGLNCSQFNITFLTTEKLSPNIKRRYEGQIMSQLNPVVQRFSSKLCIEILAVVELNCTVLASMAIYLEMDGNEEKFANSMDAVMMKHQRHRKYLANVCEHMSKLFFEKRRPVVILYALPDSSSRIFMLNG